MKTGLKALVHPFTMNQFFEMYEKNVPFAVHNLSESVAPLTDLPFLSSLDALLKSWPSLIDAHLPDVRDEVSSIQTTPKDALKLFDNGMGLLFNDAQHISPLLTQWLEEIRKDLGLSAMTYGRCLIYATPEGKGTAAHFDQNINFVLQIHGTKIWQMAPNHEVMNPLTRHTMGLPVDPELESYLEVPLLERMPKEKLTFELRPGSFLYVPRGYWHATEAEGNALSLNFTYTAPTWLDILAAALRGRLALSPEWRKTADGVADPKRRKAAEDQFNDLLTALVQDIPHWRAMDILGATDPE